MLISAIQISLAGGSPARGSQSTRGCLTHHNLDKWSGNYIYTIANCINKYKIIKRDVTPFQGLAYNSQFT